MAYVPMIFVDHSVEFPGRRLSVPVSGMANTFDISRPDGIEGTVFEEGTKPDATNLNAEFGKIKTVFDGLTGTLTAGQTSITLSDASITTDSTFFPSTSIFGVNPTAVTVVTGSITYTFPSQATDMGVKVVVL